MPTNRAEFLGLPLNLLAMSDSVAACEALVREGKPAQHVVINAGKVVQCRTDARLTDIIRGADIVNADGQSVVWAGRFLGIPVPERVTGIDLMDELLTSAARESWPVYFLGARPDVVDAVARKAVTVHPDLIVAGHQDGYFSDDAEVVDGIARSGARVLFVALPSPRKEYFVAENLDRLGPVLSVGVGGSFDVYAGQIRRAPVWMQRMGLEWLYRLIKEPRKMWRRYLVGNSVFIWMVLTARLKPHSHAR